MSSKILKKRVNLTLILSLFFVFSVFVFGQEKQVGLDKQLREEILKIYQSSGKQGLREFVKKQKEKITNQFIVDFAKAGVKKRKREWLRICMIMVKEKKDEKTTADVYLKMGEYFRCISKNKDALDFYEKALPIYVKLNDRVGQGNVYLAKGTIYYYTGDNSRAFEMYEKALPFFEKEKDLQGQGNVYLSKGNIHLYRGDYSSAFDMYDKALTFFEKAGEPLGQGNVYTNKGNIYRYTGDFSSALKMYDNALPFFEKMGEPLGQGNVYQGRGDIYLRIGDNSKALDMYDKALTFFEKAGEPIGQGNVTTSKGNVYVRIGNHSKAFKMYDKALIFFEKAGEPIGQGNVYRRKGDIYKRTGSNSKALEMYDKAMPFFEKGGQPIGQGNVYKSKGDVYLGIGDHSKALKMYDKALTFFKKARTPLGQGNVYRRKGDIHLRIGENLRALEMYDKALTFFEKAGNPIGQGNVYRRKGDIYFYTGENPKALEMYDKALIFFEKAGQPVGKGLVYLGKGNIYKRTGDNTRALEMVDKAMPFFEKAGNPIGQGNVYRIKGDIYLRIGENSKALEMFEKALPFFQKAGGLISQGNVNLSKGAIYSRIGEYSKALEMFDNALLFYERTGNPIGQGNVYNSKGDICFYTGDHSKALEMVDKALHFFKKAGLLIGQANVYNNKGDIYCYTGNNSKAIEMYNKALLLFEKAGAIQSGSNALHGKATVLVKMGKKENALDLFEKAIANLEKVRRQTAFSEMKRTFMEKVYKQYEETILLMLENKFYDKGFRYTEAMKARVFLDRMAEGLIRLDKGLPPDLKEKQDNLVAKLSLLSKEIHNTAGGKDEKKLLQLKEQYRKVEDDFEELLIKIKLNNPLYASVRYPEPVSVRTLQKQILKKGELLVRFFISPNRLYVFLISRNDFKVVPLELKKEEIDGTTERYLLAIIENNAFNMKRFGQILYNKLIRPLEKALKKNRNIIIIPDGKLATIPFESLIIDKKESGHQVFLIEKYRIKYIQSASILSVLRNHYHLDRETKTFAGFGDPVYDYKKFKQVKPEQGSMKIIATESTEGTEPILSHEDTRKDTKKNPLSAAGVNNKPERHSFSSTSQLLNFSTSNSPGDEIKAMHRGQFNREGGKLIRLKGSGQEVEAIAKLFKGKKSGKCTIYLREKATEENAKKPHLKEFDYIHFSCHGISGDGFQSLVLSQIPGAKEDGYFTRNEIMNCDYNAKLVVLSACRTGTGKMERAEGVTGLTRAVMYAGTPAVLASLWKVDDTATKELMVTFYKNMLEKNMDKTEALRQAKLELLKDEKYSSPLFWSAFVLYGE